MKILLFNGKPLPFREKETIAALLHRLNLPDSGIAVERNLEIIPRSAWKNSALTPGDRVEIVQFVGGG